MSLIIKMDSMKSEKHLTQAIQYIVNPAKTKGLFQSNTGVTTEEIIEGFLMTNRIQKSHHGKRTGYHYKFSFSKDENISPEQALRFVEEWVGEYLGEKYDYVYSVHQDRDHLHMHLVFHAVSRDGGKFRYEKGDWNRIITPLTNRLADKYHTGHLKAREEGLDYSKNYDKKNDKGLTGKERVQHDMDACIEQSKSYADFKSCMVSEFGYKLREGVSKEHGVYLALTPPDRAKAIRSYQLADGYMPADIEQRIIEQKVLRYSDGIKEHKSHSTQIQPKDRQYQAEPRPRKQEWGFSRNYTFIPYQQLSEYQQAMIRKTLDAKRLYRRTGTPLQLHEQSVRRMQKMLQETEGLGIYRKVSRNTEGVVQNEKLQPVKERKQNEHDRRTGYNH